MKRIVCTSVFVLVVLAASVFAQVSVPVPSLSPRAAEPERSATPMPRDGDLAPMPRAVSAVVPLDLATVLASVDAHYPLIRAAEQERLIAQGQQRSAEGAFDLNMTAAERLSTGTYENNRADIGFSQPLQFLGSSFYAGYRRGDNEFPTYYLDRKTAVGGEFRAGVAVPLLRDRALDRRRAALRQASINRAAAEPAIHVQRIDVARAATRAYWGWVAAGLRLRVAQGVLDIARRRDAQLAEMIKAGRLAPIDRVDNQRAIVDREARMVAAQRAIQQAGILLSLYLRDGYGAPRIPDQACLPSLPPPVLPPAEEQVKAELDAALRQRPELRRLELQREKALVDLRLAENQQMPGVSVGVNAAQDVGYGKSPLSGPNGLDRSTYEAAVLVDVPLQRRDARGRAQSARAQLAQVFAQEQMMRDRIQAELQDAVSMMQQAYEMRGRAAENVRLATEMERAEQTKYGQGQGNLLNVTIRELMAAEARALEVDAGADFYRGLADYLAALGVDPSAARVSPTGRELNPRNRGVRSPRKPTDLEEYDSCTNRCCRGVP